MKILSASEFVFGCIIIQTKKIQFLRIICSFFSHLGWEWQKPSRQFSKESKSVPLGKVIAESLTHDSALNKSKTQQTEMVSHRNGARMLNASRHSTHWFPALPDTISDHCTCVYLHVRALVTCFPNHRFQSQKCTWQIISLN